MNKYLIKIAGAFGLMDEVAPELEHVLGHTASHKMVHGVVGEHQTEAPQKQEFHPD